VFRFTIRGACEAAADEQTDNWVNAFLSNGLGANALGANVPMALGLLKQQRWWIGPVLVPVASLTRICGPEPEMDYRTSVEGFEAKVAAIAAIEPSELPPLILEYRGISLGLCDGSHRHEAARRRGAESIWALIWCNSESDFHLAKAVYGRPADRVAP
jgi:hypothetical protein